jgi:hypothetical protein
VDRRTFLRLGGLGLAAFLAGLRPYGAACSAAAEVEIAFAHSLEFVRLDPEPVALSDSAYAYLAYGNDYARKMLAAKTVRDTGHMVLDAVEDFESFSRLVQRDLMHFLSPVGSRESLAGLSVYQALNLSIRLAAKKIRYTHGIAALAGNDDVDFDGRPDGLDMRSLKKLGAKSMRRAMEDPMAFRHGLLKKSARLDRMPLDELYRRGRGVCRHISFTAMAVFQVLKSLNPDLHNLYLASIASPRDSHQWLQAAAVAGDKITFSFYDPTASTAKRARTVGRFKEKRGDQRYLGLPSEAEIRRVMGLER